jgi:ubiquitin C-terminal hydrolase
MFNFESSSHSLWLSISGMISVSLLTKRPENSVPKSHFDIDLRLIRLFMEQLSAYSSKDPLNNTLNVLIDTDPSCDSSTPILVPSIDSLLLICIRYLQLADLIPWSSPLSICDIPKVSTKRNDTHISEPLKTKLKKQKKQHQKPALNPGLCGLANIGNTCFMNSAIQCLSNIPQLTAWAKNQQPSNYHKSVTRAYTSLIRSMWSGENSCVSPRDIKQRVSQHAPIFCDYAQKDSHEFMNSLLNALHSELEENRSSEEQTSIVTDLFRIQTESRVTCLACDNYDPIEETTYCLPLPLGDEPTVALDTLVDEFLKEEQLDGEYYCSHCEGLRLAKQKTRICQPLPPVIIVQLKRFTFDETDDKLNTLVDYPIVNWAIDRNDSSLYDLAAVSMHVGNLKQGHYTTIARLNGSNQWYYFNDSSIEPIHDSHYLVNRNAYVLVYLKKN